ncbi:MAG: hypothetical protein Tsb004_30170 [Allomuricauda sp.]
MFETEGFPLNTIETLKAKGYQINEVRTRIIGKVDAIRVLENDLFEGGADKRGDDTALGY